jgi:hypothetical protein
MSNKYVKGYEPDLNAGNFHPNAYFDPAVKFAHAGDPKAAAEAQKQQDAAAVELPDVETLTAPAAETLNPPARLDEGTEGGALAEPPVTDSSTEETESAKVEPPKTEGGVNFS